MHGRAFAPHRHDVYTLGVTLNGVQSFDYRGEARHSQPGELFILHPDELHDGRAGTDAPFRYRALALRPDELQAALDGRPLPFIETGQCVDPELTALLCSLLEDFDHALDPLEWKDALSALGERLCALAGAPVAETRPDDRACEIARDLIHERLDGQVCMEELEAATGACRYALSRDFRRLFGVSPYRYWMLRRLDRVRERLVEGAPLAHTAYACGFSDQAHLTRQFKSAYGLTPNAWRRLVRTRLHDRSIKPGPGSLPRLDKQPV